MRGCHEYRLRCRYQILCVGADRRVSPRFSKINALAPELLIHACAVDVSHSCRGRRMLREILMPNWFGWAFRYRSLANVGRPSPMAGVMISKRGNVCLHRGWCPPCQPPNVCWFAVSESWPIRLAALPLNIPPRIALTICFVLTVRLTTQTPRRGGPPCPPAYVGVVVTNIPCVADAKFSA